MTDLIATDPAAPPGRLGRDAPAESGTFSGSDVFEAYTAEYTWYANQLGHFALGFVGAHFVLWIGAALRWAFAAAPAFSDTGASGAGDWLWSWEHVVILAAWVIYLGKEVQDYRACRTMAGPFRPDRDEVLLDCAADTFFVSFGALLAVCAGLRPVAFAIFLVGMGIAWLFGRRYLPGKRAFDRSELPFYYRLAKFRGDLRASGPQAPPSGAAAITGFIESFPARPAAAATAAPTTGESARHMLLYGLPGTGKTPVAVGVGCELTLREVEVRYATAFKLIEDPRGQTGKPRADPQTSFLDGVDLLVIDDVDIDVAARPGAAVLDPADFLNALDADLRRRLKGLRTVWVLGNPLRLEAWRSALAGELGDEERSLLQIEMLSAGVSKPTMAAKRRAKELRRKVAKTAGRSGTAPRGA